MTADFRTLQNKAIFSRSPRAAARSQRHSRTSGWTPRLGKLAHRLLGRLGLQLAGGGDPRHQSRVDADRLAAAELVPQLADRFDERQAFNVADRPANLANDEVQSVDLGQRELLDRVGDVRDDLDGGAEIIAAPLLGDDVAVDLPGGDVVGLARRNAGEAFIVTEVEVGLRTVIGHIDFAVLIGRHRPRIDVQIGIEFPDPDLVATRLEKRPEGRRKEAFSKR